VLSNIEFDVTVFDVPVFDVICLYPILRAVFVLYSVPRIVALITVSANKRNKHYVAYVWEFQTNMVTTKPHGD